MKVRILTTLLGIAGLATWMGNVPVLAAENPAGEPESFELREEQPGGQGNIFNLIFGTPPDMPTERGKIIIRAFHDENGNNNRDPGEEEIRNEVSCTVDEIAYRVPAFIPGLDLSGNYDVTCAGEEGYLPLLLEPQIFIERRGQIIHLELPCQRLGPAHEAS